MMDLNERFQTVLEDEPPLGFDPDQLVDGLRRDDRRRRVVIAAGLLSAVAVVAVGAGVLQTSDAERRPAQPADQPSTPNTPPESFSFTATGLDSRVGGEQEVNADPAVFELFGQGTPALSGDAEHRVDSFVVDSYPGDRGTLQIRRGTEVLFEVALGQHDNYAAELMEPWIFPPDQPPLVAVSCQQSGRPDRGCEAGVTFEGQAITR